MKWLDWEIYRYKRMIKTEGLQAGIVRLLKQGNLWIRRAPAWYAAPAPAYCAAGTDAAVPVPYRRPYAALPSAPLCGRCTAEWSPLPVCPFPVRAPPVGPSPYGGSTRGRAAGPALRRPESSAGSPAMHPRPLPAGRSHYPSPSAARSFRCGAASAALCRPHCRPARHSKADAGTAVLHHCGPP